MDRGQLFHQFLVDVEATRRVDDDDVQALGARPFDAAGGNFDSVAVSSVDGEWARSEGLDVVIVDTAGRLHVDEELMEELASIHSAVKPLNVMGSGDSKLAFSSPGGRR